MTILKGNTLAMLVKILNACINKHWKVILETNKWFYHLCGGWGLWKLVDRNVKTKVLVGHIHA